MPHFTALGGVCACVGVCVCAHACVCAYVHLCVCVCMEPLISAEFPQLLLPLCVHV